MDTRRRNRIAPIRPSSDDPLLRGAYSLVANAVGTAIVGVAFWVTAARLFDMVNWLTRFLPSHGPGAARAVVRAYALTASRRSSSAAPSPCSLFSASDGGVPQVVAQLAVGLESRGWQSSVAGPESAPIYGVLDIFVLPSRHEGLSVALIEALACGVPQVSTTVGGTAEAVSDGVKGLLCPPEDSAALADCVVRLLSDDRLRARMSRASFERHERLVRLERMLDQTAALFDAVASGEAVPDTTAQQAARSAGAA